MADEGATDEQPVSFHIKTAGDAKYTVKVPLSMSVSGLKQILSTEEYANLPADRQRLIYSGRVLKDGDALATYKIKEGNTVHLVKAAQSNAQNQTSGGGPTPNTSGTSGTTQTQRLPSMAAGTGANNLLAGLTGARFAGLAQLPNQSMFGPDGGMGAPPDPEEAIRHLENPEARRQLNEYLSNPTVLDEMIRQNPMLANLPNARQMLQSPWFREMMTNPDMMRQSMMMQRAMGGGGLGGGSPSSGSPFQAPGGVESGEGGSTAGSGSGAGATGQQGQAAANPFAAMFGMPPGGAGAGAAENPFAALMNPNMFGAGAQGQQGGDSGQEGGANRDMPQSPFASPFANPMAQQMARNMMNNPQLMQQMMQAMFGSSAGGEQGQTGDQSREGGASTATEGVGGTSEGTTDQQQPVNPFAALLGGGMPGGGAGANPLASMFGNMGAFGGVGSGGGPPDNRPPEERYADQLGQLNDMGFYDFDQNIAALRRSGGSVQGAVNYLLGG